MSEPTTDQVRLDYVHAYPSTREGREIAGAEFDRWMADMLAAHDATKRAEWEAEQGETEWEES